MESPSYFLQHSAPLVTPVEIRDTGFHNLDLSVSKSWKFYERLSVQFRAEFFNITNHPNFANPWGGTSGFGAGATADPSVGPFGCGCSTPDVAAVNPVSRTEGIAGGFRVVTNVGASAGQSVDHLHLHVLPRWAGDTNFMTSIGETRVLPEILYINYEKLTLAFGQTSS